MSDASDRLVAEPIGVQSPEVVLAEVPAPARLFLRDHIKGLEAEAGNARASARAAERLRADAVERWERRCIDLTAKADEAAARSQRDAEALEAARGDLDRAKSELHVAEARIDELTAQLGAAASAGESRWAKLRRGR